MWERCAMCMDLSQIETIYSVVWSGFGLMRLHGKV